MPDDEERVMHLQIHRYGSEHDAGHASEQKSQKESDDVQERRLPARPGTPDGGDPAEHLHGRRNRDHETRRREEALADLRQPGREHVMYPQAEPQECCRDEREDYGGVAEHLAPAECGENEQTMPSAGRKMM